MNYRVDISYKTILFIVFFLVALWIVYLIKDVILLFFVAFILMSALTPLVDKLVRIKMPRPLAILVVFLIVVGGLAMMVTFGFTPLINQVIGLSQNLTNISATLLRTNLVNQSVINQEIANLSHQVVSFTVSFFENLIAFISVIVITFYLLLDREEIEERAVSLFGGRGEKVRRLIDRIEYKLGAWLRGQIVLSAVIGILVYVGLLALGIDNALPLAIIAAFLEVIPVIGPIISAIPAVLIALTISPLSAGLVAGMYLAIQELEGHILVPQVMKRAVGLNPLLVILAITVGSRLLGIAGALLAVPIAVVIQATVEEVLKTETTHQV